MVLLTGPGLHEVSQRPRNLRDFVSTHCCRRKSSEFTSQTVVEIRQNQGLLYVCQNEVGISVPEDENVHILGSEDATTCHILVLRNPETGKTGIAHLDRISKHSMDKFVRKLFSNKVQQRLKVNIFGGFDDENEISEQLSLDLLAYLVQSSTKFEMDQCVIGEQNTHFSSSSSKFPRPIIYGVAVDVKSGSIFPATFPDQGPDIILRHVRMSYRQLSEQDFEEENHNLYDNYDYHSGEFKIRPFRIRQMAEVSLIAKAPDQFILEHLSTSPKVEPKHFSQTIRSTAQFILNHPHPDQTLFVGNKPRVFTKCKHTGEWIKC